jgi:hypothetical protein
MKCFEAGFTRVYVHSASPDEIKFIQMFSKKVSRISVTNQIEQKLLPLPKVMCNSFNRYGLSCVIRACKKKQTGFRAHFKKLPRIWQKKQLNAL